MSVQLQIVGKFLFYFLDVCSYIKFIHVCVAVFSLDVCDLCHVYAAIDSLGLLGLFLRSVQLYIV
jgi:hypothetical protein